MEKLSQLKNIMSNSDKMNIEARDPNNFIKYAKRKAAEQAVEENIRDGMKIGIGSGTTIVYVVEKLAKLYNSDELDEIICVPTSFQSEQLILNAGLPMSNLNQYPNLDVTIDGAYEIDINLNCIKGGGGCALKEKIVASNSGKLVIVADYRKKSEVLGQNWKKGVPLEVIPSAWVPIKKTLEKIAKTVRLRTSLSKAGPVITDSGNFILDTDFGNIENPKELNNRLIKIPGLVETGLFINLAYTAYIGNRDGTVEQLYKTF